MANPNWYPGMPSPNKSGRPKGIVDKRQRVSRLLADGSDELAEVIKAKALEGDMAAAALWLSRVDPPLRSRPPTVEFAFSPDLTIEENGAAILTAVSRGQVDPDTGKMLLDMLSAYAGLRDVTVLLEELRKLYAKKGSELPGGVLTVPMQNAQQELFKENDYETP